MWRRKKHQKFSRISTVFNMTWRCECISMFLWHRKKKISFILAHNESRNERKVRHSKNVFFVLKPAVKKFFYISTWKWGSSTSHDRTEIKCLKNKMRTTYIQAYTVEKKECMRERGLVIDCVCFKKENGREMAWRKM